MNTLAGLLLDLGQVGVELAPHPAHHDCLRHRPAALAPELAARLRMHKAAILALMAEGYTPTDPEAAYILFERLGIADDSGMPTHPGSAAWSLAVAESLKVVALVESCGYDRGDVDGDTDVAAGRGAVRPDAVRDQQGHGYPGVGAVAFRGERARAAVGEH